MGLGSSLYKLVYLLHLATVVVGFGSAMAGSSLSARARELDAGPRHVLDRAALQVSRTLTTGPVVAAGVLGLILVVLSDEVYKFSQMWISIAFLLYFAVIAVLVFLIAPNGRAMDQLGAALAAGGTKEQAAELDERAKKAAAFTGVVHLLWVLLLIDMVWKPGF